MSLVLINCIKQLIVCVAYVFGPVIWWIGSRMKRSGSEVQILQMYS